MTNMGVIDRKYDSYRYLHDQEIRDESVRWETN